MSWLLRARELLLGMYTNLPNLLVAGTLLVGGLTGILPLIIFGACAALVWSAVYTLQFVLQGIVGDKLIISKLTSIEQYPEFFINKWVTLLSFASTYALINAIIVYSYGSAENVDQQLIDNRQSYMVSCMIAIVLLTFTLLIIKFYTGLDRSVPIGKNILYVVGFVLSLGLGGGAGYFLWSMVTKSNTTQSINNTALQWGDLFQVIPNVAKGGGSTNTPSAVLCTPTGQ
jgi:hypothetical protein